MAEFKNKECMRLYKVFKHTLQKSVLVQTHFSFCLSLVVVQGGIENSAKTVVKGRARMPDAEEVGEAGKEGAKKVLGEIVDGMMPILSRGDGKNKRRRNGSDDDDEGNKRRKDPTKEKAR